MKKDRYYISAGAEGFYPMAFEDNYDINMDFVFSGNVQFMIDDRDKYIWGIGIGYYNLSYSYNYGYDNEKVANLNFSYLPISLNMKYYFSRKLNTSRIFLEGGAAYCLPIGESEIDNIKIKADNSFKVNYLIGVTIPFENDNIIDLYAGASFMLLEGITLNEGINTKVLFLQFGATYRFIL
jgi:hypothetical protein